MIIAAENHLVCRLRCSGHLSFQRDLFFIALHIWTEWSSKEFAAILIWVLKPMWKLQYICISFASFANNWVHSYIQSSLFHLRTSMSLSSNIKGIWIFLVGVAFHIVLEWRSSMRTGPFTLLFIFLSTKIIVIWIMAFLMVYAPERSITIVANYRNDAGTHTKETSLHKAPVARVATSWD